MPGVTRCEWLETPDLLGPRGELELSVPEVR
jgi:hypothetical protein